MKRSRIDWRTVVPRRGRQGPPADQRTALDFREVDRAEFNWPPGRTSAAIQKERELLVDWGLSIDQVGSEYMR